jgi:hypothetical protein
VIALSTPMHLLGVSFHTYYYNFFYFVVVRVVASYLLGDYRPSFFRMALSVACRPSQSPHSPSVCYVLCAPPHIGSIFSLPPKIYQALKTFYSLHVCCHSSLPAAKLRPRPSGRTRCVSSAEHFFMGALSSDAMSPGYFGSYGNSEFCHFS